MSSHASALDSPFTCIQRDSVKLDLRASLRNGLASKVKYLPSELLWDDIGLGRFESIRTAKSLDYYPSRKETEVISEHADDISRTILSGSTIIELGSGYVLT